MVCLGSVPSGHASDVRSISDCFLAKEGKTFGGNLSFVEGHFDISLRVCLPTIQLSKETVYELLKTSFKPETNGAFPDTSTWKAACGL